jgi:hypothetical protein
MTDFVTTMISTAVGGAIGIIGSHLNVRHQMKVQAEENSRQFKRMYGRDVLKLRLDAYEKIMRKMYEFSKRLLAMKIEKKNDFYCCNDFIEEIDIARMSLDEAGRDVLKKLNVAIFEIVEITSPDGLIHQNNFLQFVKILDVFLKDLRKAAYAEIERIERSEIGIGDHAI